jgi:DNA-binding IclR family transcriptional regulator
MLMNDITATPESAKYRVPVIGRMMDVLAVLETRPDGATLRDLVDLLRVPRTTVYRILNTLHHHDMVRRSTEGSYRLGSRLIILAAHTVADTRDYDLATLSKPHLTRLSEDTGEGSKISVLDGSGILVIAGANGGREYALTIVPGQRLPLHAGAAGKVLLASLPKAEQTECLRGALVRYTSRTLVDPTRLKTELARIKRQGWAKDKGEYAPSIWAFAAPIPDWSGKVVAALSVPFLAGASASHIEDIRAATIAGAAAIASDIPSPTPVRPAWTAPPTTTTRR